MTYYYIAFSEANSEGNVIAYGSSPNPTSGITPIGSEEIFEDYASFSARLSELGFSAGSEESYALPLTP